MSATKNPSDAFYKHAKLKPGNKKIPEVGKVYAEIPVEACKAYPIRIFEDLNVKPRIAVADRNTRKDKITLYIRFEPEGCKSAMHPQIAFYIKGDYHAETLGYYQSNPFDWATWFEFYLDARDLKQIIEALIRVQLQLEGI